MEPALKDRVAAVALTAVAIGYAWWMAGAMSARPPTAAPSDERTQRQIFKPRRAAVDEAQMAPIRLAKIQRRPLAVP